MEQTDLPGAEPAPGQFPQFLRGDLARLLEARARAPVPPDLQPAGGLPPIEDGPGGADLGPRDLLAWVRACVRLADHQLESYDELVTSGLNHIMTNHFDVQRRWTNSRAGKPGEPVPLSFSIRVRFRDVSITKPKAHEYGSGQFVDLLPARARLCDHPYSGEVTMSVAAEVAAHWPDGRVEQKFAEIENFHVGSFPVMVGSALCHTRAMSREALKAVGEDPEDLGGAFIARSGEYVVNLLENIRYNSVHLHTRQRPNELVRAEFLSQPGGAFENSSQVRTRLMESGAITVEINSVKFEKVMFPFYVIWRLFGVSAEGDIADHIVGARPGAPGGPAPDSPAGRLARRMLEMLDAAFRDAGDFGPEVRDMRSQAQLTGVVARRLLQCLTNPGAYGAPGPSRALADDPARWANLELLGAADSTGGLDRMLLPHLGLEAGARWRKLRFLGDIVRQVLLVRLGALPPTDRDHYANKRVHGAGVSLAKYFKTQVNGVVVRSIVRALRTELDSSPWPAVAPATLAAAVKTSLRVGELNRAMEQAITSGQKATVTVTRGRSVRRRVSSQALERKNALNALSALRTVETQNGGNEAKQTERADLMRRVHASYGGYICIAHSADTGEVVGMRKQLALTATVCLADDAGPLLRALARDPAVVPLEAVAPADGAALAQVRVNGFWLGYTAAPGALADRYRRLRREGRVVPPRASVVLAPLTGAVEFWLDVGRLTRPLLIVDNNLAAYAAGERGRGPRVPFCQGVRLTRAHAAALAAGALTLDALVAAGVAEWIAPEEAENCLAAPSLGALLEARADPARAFTHCDVPQALFGVAAHASPYGNHTQPARVTYETNQARQTGGWYCAAFPFRADKNRFFQYYNDLPPVRPFPSALTAPSGMNVVLAYLSYGGDNQEDSAIVSQAAADRGLFAGAFFRYERVELEQGERFELPDPLTVTRGLRPGASYAKLRPNGLVRVGSVVRAGDVLVGRTATQGRGAAGGPPVVTDRSLVYSSREPAVVEAVVCPRGANDELFVIVKLRYERPLRVGDKMSSRSGNKSIVALMLSQADLPYGDDGLTPDIIVNTHCVPTRMTVGQLIETEAASTCARRGAAADGTAFLPVDHAAAAAAAVSVGRRAGGLTRLYHGATGEPLDAAVCIGPTTEQRLQKFVLDEEQCVGGSGPTDASSGQPIPGKSHSGGLRLGEMEGWTFMSHGAVINLFEKHFRDSDGRDSYVCRGCGRHAVVDLGRGIVRCGNCGDAADVARVASAKSALLFNEELNSANVGVRQFLRPREFDAPLRV